MRTPCCKRRLVVHTDPKNAEYVIAEGGRRKAESFHPEDAGTVELPSAEERHARLADPLARLEHEVGDRGAAREAAAEVAALRAASEARHRDDYARNKAARAQMRGVRKEEQAADARRRQLNLPEHVRLLPEAPGDALRASAVHFGEQRFDANWRKARRGIAGQGIFAAGAVAAAARGGGSARPGAPSVHRKPGGSGSGSGGGSGGGLPVLAAKKRRLEAGVKLKFSDPGAKRPRA